MIVAPFLCLKDFSEGPRIQNKFISDQKKTTVKVSIEAAKISILFNYSIRRG